MKVALCFWGLTRSLKHTYKSIQKYIMQPLKENGVEYTIFLHSYQFDSPYVNPRAKEVNVTLDFDEYTLLHPHFVQIDDQDKIKTQLHLEAYRNQKDPWESNYICVDNFLCAMYSKKVLGNMIQDSGLEFDACIFLRPDVLYLNPFDCKWLSLIQDKRVCIPNFALFPRFNDRFFLCSQEHAYTYTNLFDDLLEYSYYYPLHSETCQHRLLQEKYKLKIVYIPIHFNRVRVNGIVLPDYNPHSNKRMAMHNTATLYKPSVQKKQKNNVKQKRIPVKFGLIL